MIAAIVLAAGLSKRMGQPKMVLPWGGKTVIGQVVDSLITGGIDQIIVVTGGTRLLVEEALPTQPVTFANNPNYANGEMLSSLQVGLQRLDFGIESFLMVLGDQPQIEPATVSGLIDAFKKTSCRILIPSYQMRRGHPWLIERSLWQGILALQPPATLRDFLKGVEKEISYLPVDTPSILNDLDTFEDYQNGRPTP